MYESNPTPQQTGTASIPTTTPSTCMALRSPLLAVRESMDLPWTIPHASTAVCLCQLSAVCVDESHGQWPPLMFKQAEVWNANPLLAQSRQHPYTPALLLRTRTLHHEVGVSLVLRIEAFEPSVQYVRGHLPESHVNQRTR